MSYIIFWTTIDGNNQWVLAANRDDASKIIEKIVENPFIINKSVMMCSATMANMKWAFPDTCHSGETDVNISTLTKYQISGYGDDIPKQNQYSKIKVMELTEENLGWISPDGKFYTCEYGGHMQLARKLTENDKNITDAERHLEDNGWIKIYKNPLKDDLAVGAGQRIKATDAQLITLEKLGYDNLDGISKLI